MSAPQMPEDERLAMEKKGLEEQKLKEALMEKTPEWSIYCYTGEEDLCQQNHWIEMIQRQFDAAAGDETDRWNTLQD